MIIKMLLDTINSNIIMELVVQVCRVTVNRNSVLLALIYSI